MPVVNVIATPVPGRVSVFGPPLVAEKPARPVVQVILMRLVLVRKLWGLRALCAWNMANVQTFSTGCRRAPADS